MLTYVIVVNDNGELKTITQDDVDNLQLNLEHGYDVESIINEVLDDERFIQRHTNRTTP